MDKLLDEFEFLLKQINQKANEIMSEAENLSADLDILQEKYDNLEQDVKDNYKPITPYEMYDVSESDFH